MFRRQRTESVLVLPEADPALRDEPDPDPVVQAAADRLREQLSSLQATDEWGRPVTWRQVARIALGPLGSPRVRDALTVDLLTETLTDSVDHEPPRSVSPDVTGPDADWKAFFRGLDERDRLLERHPGITLEPGPN
jgi:hypothetical protein